MINFKFNQDKAIAALLFIAHRLIMRHGKNGADLHKIFKIMYFADQKHLAAFARPITGDFYIAMKDGGVPSRIYEMVKMVRGDSICQDIAGFKNFFEVFSGHFLFPKQESVMDEFSQSDLECLEVSIVENQDLTFEELRKKSHDQAYEKANKDDKISFREMAKVLDADETVLEFMKLNSENESILNT
jgi:uncharacterized phage-associated protein